MGWGAGVLLGDGKSLARRTLEEAVLRALAGLPAGVRVTAASPPTERAAAAVVDALFEDHDARWALREYLAERRRAWPTQQGG